MDGRLIWTLGPLHTDTVGVAGVGLALYVDRLSAAILVLVSFVGVAVVRYSSHYMAGDPHQRQFTRWLCLTLTAVLLVIVSGNLAQFLVAWIATSLGLHRLLLFYPDRPAAILAARKKFIASRLGDACLVVTLVVLYREVHSLDYPAVFAYAAALRDAPTIPRDVHLAALLLVVAALLKSAQFPFHGWLTEVMETPTPVSALLHAGVINAGGFLILRFSPLIALSTPSLDLLLVTGGLTALFGSAVMPTQTSVKLSLAFSTIAQMGFMMFECGLGAFSAALLHIVAHSLYKAHAFLSSGGILMGGIANGKPRTATQPPGRITRPWKVTAAILVAVALEVVVGVALGVDIARMPAVFVLCAIVLMGLVHLVFNTTESGSRAGLILRGVGLAVGVAGGYAVLQWVTEQAFLGSMPAVPPHGLLETTIIVVILTCFAGLTILQNAVPDDPHHPRWQALYVHIANGLYVNAFANRLALRFWPASTR